MTLEQILSEFDEKYRIAYANGYVMSVKDTKKFIRQSFSKYQEGLVAAIEMLKATEREGVYIQGRTISEAVNIGYNAALTMVIKLLKKN